MGIKQLRKMMLDGAEELLQHKIAQATGKPSKLDISLISKEQQKDIWDALVPMIQKADEVTKLKAESSADVMKALAEGEISANEALSLMGMVEKAFEMTELKVMNEKLDNLNG